MPQKKYQIFDHPDYTTGETLVLASNANIQEVCRVFCEHGPHTFEQRHYYAKRGDIAPDEIKDGEEIYNFTNRTQTDAELFARLAAALFNGGPELLINNPDDEDLLILDPEQTELIGAMLRNNIHHAVTDFFLSFGTKMYTSNSIWEGLTPGLIGRIIEQQYQPQTTTKPGQDSTQTPTSGDNE